MAPSALLCGTRAAAPVRRCRVAPAAACSASPRAAGRRASVSRACTCSLAGSGSEPRRASSRPPAAIASPPAGPAAPAPAPAAAGAAPDALPLVLPEDLVVAPGVVVPVKRDDAAPACDFNGYLRRILTARVYELAVRLKGAAKPLRCERVARALRLTRPAPRAQVETPLELAPRLSERLGRGNSVLLKREDMQPVFSFKVRSRLPFALLWRRYLVCMMPHVRRVGLKRPPRAAPRRIQPHCAAVCGDARSWCRHCLGGQPRAGRGAVRAAAERVRRGVHAGYNARHQG